MTSQLTIQFCGLGLTSLWSLQNKYNNINI